MKCLISLLLVSLVAGSGAVFGQVYLSPVKRDSLPVLHLPMRRGVPGLFVTRGTVRVMRPDNMPCVVPDLAGVEAMPVLRGRGKDNMPQVGGK